MKQHTTPQTKNLARSLPSFRPDLRPRRSTALTTGSSRAFTGDRLYPSKKVTLVDALDRVIDKGAYVDGELVLRVADIDLVFIGLRLLVTSVSRAEKLRRGERMGPPSNPTAKDVVQIKKLEQQLHEMEANIPKIIDAGDPQKAEKGIAKLVLTLIELIRQLLEREAVRRVDTGTLSETEMQKLGLTFQMLEKKIHEFKAVFGIREELNLELGPLGNLL
ncbi:MAG: gas vesicle protein GvpJ [Patescibacteria group bacterium]